MIRKAFLFSAFILTLVTFAVAAPAPSARDLVAVGRIDAAVAALKTRLSTNPRDAEAYHLLSRAWLSIQRWDEAISNGERAVAIQPNNAEYHLWLGRAYGEKAGVSNFIAAAELAKKVRVQFEQAVQLNGNDASARSDLAEYYMDAPGFLGGGKDKARSQAAQLMKIDPASAHWIYGTLAEKDKKYDVSEREFKSAIATSKDPAKRWLDLASFYRSRGRAKDMEDAVYKALGTPGRQPHVLYDAAEILYRGGRNFTGAVDLLRSYLSSGDPSEDAPLFQTHYLLGSLLEKLGDRAGAAQEYRAALSVAKDFQKAQVALKRVQ